MAHGQKLEAVLLTSHPSGSPQGVCVWVCICVLVSLQLYSRPPCALNTTGFRSKGLEHGLPVNLLPVHHGVTHEHTPMCLYLLISKYKRNTSSSRAPVNKASWLQTLFFFLTVLRNCPLTSVSKWYILVLTVINITIKHRRHKTFDGNHHPPTSDCGSSTCKRSIRSVLHFLACCCHLNLIV